jgi:hypothetical protein
MWDGLPGRIDPGGVPGHRRRDSTAAASLLPAQIHRRGVAIGRATPRFRGKRAPIPVFDRAAWAGALGLPRETAARIWARYVSAGLTSIP